MSGLLFLSSDDFILSKGTKGNILCTSIPGFSLILFYSTQCPHCHNVLPIFKRLPGSINGCQFGILNVSTNKSCVKLSKDTIAPILYVPQIILYINGRPYMRFNYQGPNLEQEIKRFVIEVAEKVQSKQKFSSEKVVQSEIRGHIPAFCIGIPKTDDLEICYLQYDEAYD